MLVHCELVCVDSCADESSLDMSAMAESVDCLLRFKELMVPVAYL